MTFAEYKLLLPSGIVLADGGAARHEPLEIARISSKSFFIEK
jgi:hypothetical protein